MEEGLSPARRCGERDTGDQLVLSSNPLIAFLHPTLFPETPVSTHSGAFGTSGLGFVLPRCHSRYRFLEFAQSLTAHLSSFTLQHIVAALPAAVPSILKAFSKSTMHMTNSVPVL